VKRRRRGRGIRERQVLDKVVRFHNLSEGSDDLFAKQRFNVVDILIESNRDGNRMFEK